MELVLRLLLSRGGPTLVRFCFHGNVRCEVSGHTLTYSLTWTARILVVMDVCTLGIDADVEVVGGVFQIGSEVW